MSPHAVGRANGSAPPFEQRTRPDEARPRCPDPRRRIADTQQPETHHPRDVRLLPSHDPLPSHYLQIPVARRRLRSAFAN